MLILNIDKKIKEIYNVHKSTLKEEIKMKKTRMEKGITLIALIITIVVLLILAAVAISSITNDGILSYAQNAAKDYNKAVLNEKYYLTELEELLKENQTGVKVEKVTDSNPGVLEGSGTQADPYVVNSMEDFVFFSYDVNSGNTYAGKYVKLEYDLDFNSTKSYVEAFRKDYSKYGYEGELKTALTSGEGWIPIGKSSETTGNAFAGIFDGNGKTISNLIINKENNITTDIGLFTSNRGTIKKLGIKDCNISINHPTNLDIPLNTGTICGYNYGVIDGCWVSGSIDGNSLRVGGIAGALNDSFSSQVCISNCYNKVNINITNLEASVIYIGGIAGGNSRGLISNCYNVGTLVGQETVNKTLYLGGIVGGSGNVSKCYNIGPVNGKSSTANPWVGGIAGIASSVDYCCNIGTVAYEGPSSNYVGTILGATEGTLSNSYALTNATLNGIGKNWSLAPEPTKLNTVAEMPTVLEIVGNAFKADTNNINNGYPILSWQ